jgi:hypothetical protein
MRTCDFAFVSLCYGRRREDMCTGYAMAASGQMQYDYKQTNKHLEIFHPLLLRSRVPCKFGGAALSIKTTKGGLVHTLGMWGKGVQVSYNTWRLDSQAPPETKKLHNYPPEHSYSFARSQAATRCRNQDSKNSQASKETPKTLQASQAAATRTAPVDIVSDRWHT